MIIWGHETTIPAISIISVMVLILLFGIIVTIFYYRNVRDTLFDDQKQVYQDPYVYADMDDPYNNPIIVNNVITKEICDRIIDFCLDVADNRPRFVEAKYNQQFSISKTSELAQPIVEKLAKMVGLKFDQAEDIVVFRYSPYQTYPIINDSCCFPNDKCQAFIKRGGQRVTSIVIYLNDEFEGGETIFPNINKLTVLPSVGSAIVYYPLAANSTKCHPKGYKVANPVSSGIKWTATLYFRENTYV